MQTDYRLPPMVMDSSFHLCGICCLCPPGTPSVSTQVDLSELLMWSPTTPSALIKGGVWYSGWGLSNQVRVLVSGELRLLSGQRLSLGLLEVSGLPWGL